MAISDQVRNELFQPATAASAEAKAIRIPTTRGGSPRSGPEVSSSKPGRGLWTPEEHLRFLEALDKFPSGPWKCIAQYVGTKTARQAMTHGQKYRQKIARRRRGLKKIVRDFQFAETSEHQEGSDEEEVAPRLSVESLGLTDEEFDAFICSLDLAQELHSPPLSDSPLVVPSVTTPNEDMATFSLEDLEVEPMELCMEAPLLPETTAQQDVHHWVVMGRADASSEEFSLALEEAFHGGNVNAEVQAFAKPTPPPEQALYEEDPYEDKSAEPLPLDFMFEDVTPLQFDGFELR